MEITKVDKHEVIRRLRYEADTGKIFWNDGPRSGRECFTYTQKRGYKATTFRSNGFETTLTAHRVAWLLHTGDWPSGHIDHVNGVRTDNRISNLRDVVQAENARNMAMSKRNKSGVTGVYLHSQTGKWAAQINTLGKTIGLGCFESKSDAVIARKAAERVLFYHSNHGRDAR